MNELTEGRGSAPAQIGWAERAFVTVKEAGQICGLSPASIYAAAKKGQIALHKLGGRTVVAPAELKRFTQDAATAWSPDPNKAQNTVEARAARTRASWA